MKCFFDKSEGVDDAGDKWLTLAGFGAPDRIWSGFDDQWRRVLWERYPVAPYIHMTHMVARKDPFEWGAAGWTQQKQADLIFDAVKLLQTLDKKTFLFARCSVNVSARQRLIGEGYEISDEVEICRDMCIGAIFRKYYVIDGNFSERMHIHFDRGEEFCKKLKKRWLENRTPEGQVSVDGGNLFWDIVADITELDSKYCYPLQAADMIAWSYSRGLIKTDRPYRYLSHIMQQVIPNYRADITEDVMRSKNSRSGRAPIPTMPVVSHPYVTHPPGGTVICRFMDFGKFRDLFASEELYFRRTDLFKEDDPWEALPSDDYIRAKLGLRRYDPTDELRLINEQAFLRQNSEGYFINCWQIFEAETQHMWDRYGKGGVERGVCIFSRFELMKAQLGIQLDTITTGIVRYQETPADPYNAVQFMFTKRGHFENEKELRILLQCYDPMANPNRHLDINNVPSREPREENKPHPWLHPCKRRRIDLKSLVTEIRLSPWATAAEFNEVGCWVKNKNFDCPVNASGIVILP